ncbi:alpha/beta fold hydrolase [Empedobacter falsenii]
MPYIEHSNYPKPSFLNRNSHYSTIYPAKFKKYPVPTYTREKIATEDGDFLNLDWRFQENKDQLIILFHGLEGDSKRTYLNSCSDFFYKKGFNILAWNHRSCGGEMNKTLRLYHHGSIDDVHCVIEKAINENYKNIYLIGYSMGGALVLNYLGNYTIDERIKCGVIFSAPISLKSCADELKKFPNTVYFKNFKRTLAQKFAEKAKQFPGKVNEEMIDKIKTFDEVDDYFTAPMHGYQNKEEYYTKASPATVLNRITTPCLIVNAANDPFLGDECYPIERLKNHSYCTFEMPKYGGHCGFPLENNKHSWSEIRAWEFIKSL